jgi:lipopolysaccharide transport system ATP-binding protein
MSYTLNEDVVLKVDNISKKFTQSSKASLHKKEEVFWALKNISFEVKKGTTLGIIGHNGAGKSTLLKILAEVTPPSSGYAAIKGTVLSILEIGTGFHPELSGYKNILLNASILGMSKKQTLSKIDEIIDFSGIASHIHEPIKNYSSGMYLRLALSIALFVENDILLLDEVLSVGDIDFRHKAIQKIKEQAVEGKTCIIISHDLSAIIEICDECLLLDNGRVADRGEAKLMVEKYFHIFHEKIKQKQSPVLDHILCSVISVTIEKESFFTDEPILIKLKYEVKTASNFNFCFIINSFHSRAMITSNAFSKELQQHKYLTPGFYETVCTIPSNLFNTGTYLAGLLIGSNEGEIYIQDDYACTFNIVLADWEESKSWYATLNLFPFRPNCSWITQSS